jgi:hypothetical protein
MMKAPSQTLTRPNTHGKKTIAGQLRLLAVIFRMRDRCRAFLALILVALAESRRREAERILRQYRHLIDPANDSFG